MEENKDIIHVNGEIPGKEIAIIAHLTLIGLIIAFVMNSSKNTDFGKYHIRQVLGLFITAMAIFIVSWIPFLGWLIAFAAWIIMIYMWIMGLVNAINGKKEPMPILGKNYEEWLKNV